MKHIEINIWKACNNKCRFCMSASVWEDEKQLTKFDLVEKEILKYASLGYKSIWFLWWDISIHPNLYDIITVAKKSWFENINVITNWMIFSDFKKAEKLIQAWVTRVNFSIHSHDSKIEDHLTQVYWWLKRKNEAIDNFNLLYNKWELKSPISINIVINWLNYKDILKTCVFYEKKKKISDIRLNFLWNRDFYTLKDKEELELSYTDFLPYLKKIILFSLKTKTRVTFDSIPPCIFNDLWLPNTKLIIKKFLWEDQDIIEEISNINQNITFDWKEQKVNDLKLKFDKCKKCSYMQNCQWIRREYVDIYWEEEFSII